MNTAAINSRQLALKLIRLVQECFEFLPMAWSMMQLSFSCTNQAKQ